MYIAMYLKEIFNTNIFSIDYFPVTTFDVIESNKFKKIMFLLSTNKAPVLNKASISDAVLLGYSGILVAKALIYKSISENIKKVRAIKPIGIIIEKNKKVKVFSDRLSFASFIIYPSLGDTFYVEQFVSPYSLNKMFPKLQTIFRKNKEGYSLIDYSVWKNVPDNVFALDEKDIEEFQKYVSWFIKALNDLKKIHIKELKELKKNEF